ncbi:MAG: hypothetical protein ACLRX6_07090 [Limosilactobacillus pontis]
MKRLLLFCLVVAGVLVASHRAHAAEYKLTTPDSMMVTATVASPAAEDRLVSCERRSQFRARLLRHWWQPRPFMAAISRRPTITKII